jgi:methyl-accepting chemotaxis protein
MINRLSVNTLLKSVIAIMAAVVVTMLSLSAWDSWTRLKTVDRIAGIVDASHHIFTALHNGRVDRASTYRDLMADKQFTAVSAQIRGVRAAEMPALKSALAALRSIEFPEQAMFVSRLEQSINRLTALHEQTAAELLRPKAQRRAGLAEEAFKEGAALLETLDDLSARLSRLVKLQDPFVDELMAIKQLAWVARDTAGDAAVVISNTMAGQPLPPEPMLKHSVYLARMSTAWTAVEGLAAGLPLPAKFTKAMKDAREGFLAADNIELRNKMLKTLMAGEKITIPVDEWTVSSVAKLGTLLAVADSALDVAGEHAAQQRSSAIWTLSFELGLLVGAVIFASGMMLMVSFRVTSPLHTIQEAMLRLAGGDLSAQVSFAGRKDEIGSLAGAMATFKDSMIETDRLRAEQRDAETRAAAERQSAEAREAVQRRAAEEREEAGRKTAMRKLADDFEAAVGRIIAGVSSASTELESFAGTLTKTADTTLQLAGVVASASEEASSNVGAVATAAEEMTGSVNEIARQVQESSRIAAEAVGQADKTDARIMELSHAASRIGDVVKLITAIAEQTNLLALNATIEAARAGDSGKGFAVVAQEVKALAAQTAKATDEISTQIAGMQTATRDSVAAIKEIGGTIGRISEIAATIAAAVEEQGAATGEIARNVQQAAQGTARVAANISDVNRGASETGAASAQVLSSAKELSQESNQLKTEVAKFLDTVRAA